MFHILIVYLSLYVPYMQIFFKKRHAYDAAAGAKLGFGVK